MVLKFQETFYFCSNILYPRIAYYIKIFVHMTRTARFTRARGDFTSFCNFITLFSWFVIQWENEFKTLKRRDRHAHFDELKERGLIFQTTDEEALAPRTRRRSSLLLYWI